MITLSFSKSILEKLQDNLLIALRLCNIRLYRLAGALLSYAEGVEIKEIAKLMGGGHKSHHQFADSLYLQRYEVVDRFAQPGSRTQRKLTKAQQAQLVKLIKDGPEANGFHCGIWKCAMIAEVIWLKFEVRYKQTPRSASLTCVISPVGRAACTQKTQFPTNLRQGICDR